MLFPSTVVLSWNLLFCCSISCFSQVPWLLLFYDLMISINENFELRCPNVYLNYFQVMFSVLFFNLPHHNRGRRNNVRGKRERGLWSVHNWFLCFVCFVLFSHEWWNYSSCAYRNFYSRKLQFDYHVSYFPDRHEKALTKAWHILCRCWLVGRYMSMCNLLQELTKRWVIAVFPSVCGFGPV